MRTGPKDKKRLHDARAVNVLRESKRPVIVPAEVVWDDFFDAPGADLGRREEAPPRVRKDF